MEMELFCLPQARVMQRECNGNPRPEVVGCGTDPAKSSADSLFNGRLICYQPRCGYRFSVDAVLLAHFVKPRQGWRVLDLGSGCGIITLILAYRFPDCSLVAVENQPIPAALARRNVGANGFTARIQVLAEDVRRLRSVLSPESFDCVLCNPPYFNQGRGRLSREEQAAMARHDLSGKLTDFIRAAAFAVKNRGRVAFIFPASSQARLQQELLAFRLTPKRLQMVYSYPAAKNAALVLVEAMKNGGEGCAVMPPIYLYDQPGGSYSPALQAMYQENQDEQGEGQANPEEDRKNLEERCWPQS